MAVDTRRLAQAEPALKETEDYIKFGETSEEEEEEERVATSTNAHKRKADDGDDDEGKGSEPQAGTYQKCYNGQPVPPWLTGIRRLGRGEHPDISDMVNEEVTKFVDYISPTPEEHQMRVWVIERMQRILDSMKMIAVTPVAKCFGSFETRLYLPTSDIDMTVMLYREGSTTKVAASYQTKEAVRRYLYTLARELKRAGFCYSCEVIANARVPIIKTHEMITGIAVDISINADSGVKSAAVQRSFSERVYPHSLRAIVLVIKQFLAQRSMNEVYTGGMGSYAITLLAVSMLQLHPRILSGGLDIAKNLGVLVIEFFELYGKRFNYDNVCVSVLEKGQYLDKRRKGFYNIGQPYLLSVEDPCDQTNDVTKGTYGINRIKQNFGGAYDLINNAIFAYHQTRKFGEPINDTLKWLAGRSDIGSSSNTAAVPSKKRMKALDGKAKYRQGGDTAFSDDPWAPVSFLSSILTVSRTVLESRSKLVNMFYQGTMQKTLVVEYQPQLTSLLPSAPVPAVAEISGVATETAQEQINKMDFNFIRAAELTRPPASSEPVLISDDEEERHGHCDGGSGGVIEIEDDDNVSMIFNAVYLLVNCVEDRDIDTRDKTGGVSPEESREYVVRV
ncbi:hypothetical protein GGI20_002468 [Coemansia sp. BCRC 34301]|nr:hypothetical protein GGI20_002468 [Coemansia sp. BCRC 34301]